jgi:hypothetical protein
MLHYINGINWNTMAVSFIAGGKRSTRKKPLTCGKSQNIVEGYDFAPQ